MTNGAGSDSELKTDHIIVSEAPPLTVLNANTGIRYATIQGAVTAAAAGDEIVVGDGSYTENVVIDKSLTIRSENGAATTTVTAVDTSKSAFTVNANFVTINGFSVRGTTNSNIGGIEVKNANSALITNNDVSSCSVGIRLAGTATNNTVTGNTIHGNSKYGLSIRDSAFGNFAYKNIFSANTSKDICIKDTTHDNALWLNDVNSSGVEILTSVVSHSPSPLTYTYNSGIYTSYLGNRYATYAGADADGNGVGDSVFTSSSYTDSYPLMTQSANYVETALPPAPVAVFSGAPQSGDAPLTVQFTDASTGTITGYAWDFDNDGTIDSTAPSPSHQYMNAGTYTVNLTVTNAGGSDSELKTDYITANAPLVFPTAVFSADVQTGTAPLTVTFTDASTGTAPFTYAWDFNNDGTIGQYGTKPVIHLCNCRYLHGQSHRDQWSWQ